MHRVGISSKILILGDFNSHFRREACGFVEFNVGHGVCQWNNVGMRLMYLPTEKGTGTKLINIFSLRKKEKEKTAIL